MKQSLVFSAIAAALVSGCYVESETVYVESDSGVAGAPSYAQEVLIDADATMEDIYPGVETGIYVEYLSGGLWLVYTTCGDVAEYGACEWDMVTTVADGDFIGAEGYELDVGETIGTDDVGAWTVVYTAADYDGLYVQTTPGASLELDVYLDGSPAESYVFWVGDNSVHYGAPSNPVVFVPDVM